MNIFITGASKGIGRQIAIDLSQEGNQLFLLAKSIDLLQETKKACEKKGAQVKTFAGDISNTTFLLSNLNELENCDVLINAAGLGVFDSMENFTEEQINLVLDVNIKGTFTLTQIVVKKMKKARKGLIINLISDVGKRIEENCSLYGASKFAQHAFFTTIRKELRPYSVRVSNIYTGLVDSCFHQEPQGSPSHESWLKVDDVSKVVQFIMTQPERVVIDEIEMHPMSQNY